MKTFSVGLAVLLACSNPTEHPTETAISLSGTWQMKQPSAWTDFRFTLTQGMCTKAAVNDPCTYGIAGSATSTPEMCMIRGLPALSKGGTGYPCTEVFPVTGRFVADDVALNFAQYADGASFDFVGRTKVDRSVLGDLIFTDASGVTHHVGGSCDLGPVCIETPGQLQFTSGGVVVVAHGVE